MLREVHTATDGEELGEVMLQVEPRSLNKIDTTPEYMARMKEGFYAVMHADGGYGKGYIEDHFDAAGKALLIRIMMVRLIQILLLVLL